MSKEPTGKIDWPLIAWAQAPLARDSCLGAEFYINHRRVRFKRQCFSTPVRSTTEGDFCLNCWRLLPVCEKCGKTKSVLQYHDTNLCTACYLPEYCNEYLAHAAQFVLCGRSMGAQLEEQSLSKNGKVL